MSQCVCGKRDLIISVSFGRQSKLLRVLVSTAAASGFCPEEGQRDIEKIGIVQEKLL